MYMAIWEGERIEGLNKDLRRMNLFATSAYFGLLSRWQFDKVKYKTYGAWCFILVVVCVLFTLSLVFLWIKGVQLVFLAGFEGDSPNWPCWFSKSTYLNHTIGSIKFHQFISSKANRNRKAETGGDLQRMAVIFIIKWRKLEIYKGKT